MINDIEIINLSKIYKKFKALDNISINIEKNHICGFIGPNGAGKSTTIKSIINFIKPSSGQVLVFGKSPPKLKEEKNKIRVMLDDDYFYATETALGNLLYIAKLNKVAKNDALKDIKFYSEMFDLDLKKQIRKLSRGNRRKVSIVSVLMGKPELLILDEPNIGLDPVIQAKFFDKLKELNKKNGSTIFLSSHNLNDIQTMSDSIVFIKEGKIFKQGSSQELLKREIILYYKNINILNKHYDFFTKVKDESNLTELNKDETNKTLRIIPDDSFVFLKFMIEKKILEDDILNIDIKNQDLAEIFKKGYLRS